jgi:hypothetical protein
MESIDATIKQLFAKANKESLYTTAKAISSLVLVADNKDKLITQMHDNSVKLKSEDPVQLLTKQISLLTLCEVGKYKNLCDNERIFKDILNLIQNKDEKTEDVR